MSLPFPDGASAPLETRLANAMVERLRLLHRDHGLFLAYVGEAPVMPSRMGDEAWDLLLQQLRGQTPAALVIIDSAQITTNNTTGDRWQMDYHLTVALLSTHRRDTIAGRINPDASSLADDSRDPGLRAACEIADMLMRGWRPEVTGAHAIRPGSRGMQTVFAGKSGTMRELDYSVLVDIKSSGWPEPARYLESVRTELASPIPGLAITTEVTP